MARDIIRMQSTESPYSYTRTKNKKTEQKKREQKMFDPTPGVRKHVLFVEKKVAK
ncbi:MAG: 50S ribosomal protein L33 [Gammaproteobacteria bacterium]|nr:50S ribosomal protein L33 [Gammaproteobacteria bacterium]